MNDLSGTTTLVVGASRGLGHGIADALTDAGSAVIAVSRTHSGFRPGITTEVADAADEATAARLLKDHDPDAVVLVAGASPAMLPLQEQTWETFSVNWHADVRIAFHWLRAALLQPIRPGGRVVVVSSGAAQAGSPLSGGYAGAKATQQFMTGYARDEAERAGLRITFTAILPRLTPLTDLGRPAVQAYAARAGQSEEQYLRQMGDPLTPEGAGAAVAELLGRAATSIAPAYLLTAAGLRPLP
jgi:NAD(P)-dependent dehydrogenase (short-subunit alcohol dehydrogenase family)